MMKPARRRPTKATVLSNTLDDIEVFIHDSIFIESCREYTHSPLEHVEHRYDHRNDPPVVPVFILEGGPVQLNSLNGVSVRASTVKIHPAVVIMEQGRVPSRDALGCQFPFSRLRVGAPVEQTGSPGGRNKIDSIIDYGHCRGSGTFRQLRFLFGDQGPVHQVRRVPVFVRSRGEQIVRVPKQNNDWIGCHPSGRLFSSKAVFQIDRIAEGQRFLTRCPTSHRAWKDDGNGYRDGYGQVRGGFPGCHHIPQS